jgi:hypothetical protein
MFIGVPDERHNLVYVVRVVKRREMRYLEKCDKLVRVHFGNGGVGRLTV